jgi:hypothetical protein
MIYFIVFQHQNKDYYHEKNTINGFFNGCIRSFRYNYVRRTKRKSRMPCTGSPVTVVVCFEPVCPGPVPGNTKVTLVDDDCGATVATCNISGSSPCCTITTSACSNHKFHVTYQQSGGLCSTGSFTLTGSPDTVLIPCYCP